MANNENFEIKTIHYSLGKKKKQKKKKNRDVASLWYSTFIYRNNLLSYLYSFEVKNIKLDRIENINSLEGAGII